MRRAFTLIELMITILISTIFLNFVFRFYTNILAERYYLEAKDALTYNSFRSLQIVKNGVKNIDGVITLNNSLSISDKNFPSNGGGSIKIDVSDGNLTLNMGTTYYKFQGINIVSDNFVLKDISSGKGLYLIEFNATKETLLRFSDLNRTDVTPFQRLVYTK